MKNILAPDRLLWAVHVPCLAEHNEAALARFGALTDDEITEMVDGGGRFVSTHQGGDLTMAIMDPADLKVTAVFVHENPSVAQDAARKYLITESSRARLVLKGRLIDSVANVLENL